MTLRMLLTLMLAGLMLAGLAVAAYMHIALDAFGAACLVVGSISCASSVRSALWLRDNNTMGRRFDRRLW